MRSSSKVKDGATDVENFDSTSTPSALMANRAGVDSQKGDDMPIANFSASGFGGSIERVKSDYLLPAGDQLGEDYRNYTWKKPSKAIAKQNLSRTKYYGGAASWCGTTDEDLGSMGSGITLYFKTLRLWSFLFLAMAAIALPSMIMNMQGRGILPGTEDNFRLSLTTLGNQGVHWEILDEYAMENEYSGYEDENPECEESSGCQNTTNSHFETMCDDEAGECDYPEEWYRVPTLFTDDPYVVSMIITLSDVLYSFVFLIFILYFKGKISKVVNMIDEKFVTAADYAVYVRGLPKDAKEEEILAHFSDRYDLSKPHMVYPMYLGFLGRPRPVGGKNAMVAPLQSGAQKYQKVQNLRHNPGDKKYLDKWVAEVSIANPNGKKIRRYLAIQKLTVKMRAARAQVLKYSDGTEYKRGPDPKKQQQALEKLELLEQKMKAKEQKISKSSGNSSMDDCECAFVLFNNEESRKRCLHDYRNSRSWIFKKLQPESLKFRTKFALRVTEAPEPSNILWENLEIRWKERMWRRAITGVCTLVLLILSLTFIYLAHIAKTEFKPPNFSVCGDDLPAAYYGSYNFSKSTFKLQRNQTRDNECEGGEFYLSYGPSEPLGYILDPDTSQPVSSDHYTTSEQAHSNEREVHKPVLCQDNCIDPASKETCNSIACIAEGYLDKKKKCKEYVKSAAVNCYCKDLLSTNVKLFGLWKGGSTVLNSEPMCRKFVENFFYSISFMILSSLVVVFVNTALKGILRKLAKFERHDSVSDEAKATTFKIFIAQFLNTAVIVLLVNARLPNNIKLPLPPHLGLLEGEFSDFYREWYSVVGATVCTTMLFNVVTPHVGPILHMFLIHPLKRCLKGWKMPTQDQLDQLYEGPVFEISTRYPFALNTLFVTLFYCGGMPILLPLGALSFWVSYQLEKLALLRMYSKPPMYDETLARMVLGLMPYALVAHLCMSLWMYGNSEILRSDIIPFARLFANAQSDSSTPKEIQLFLKKIAQFDPFKEEGLIVKVVRQNVFPIFLLLAMVITGMIFYKLSSGFIESVLRRLRRAFYYLFCCCMCGKSKTKPSTKVIPAKASKEDQSSHESVDEFFEIPPYTGDFRQPISQGYHLDKAQIKNGYQIEKSNVVRYWTHDGDVDGVKHRKGERMLTWEAMGSLHSYRILNNKKYQLALRGLYEAHTKSKGMLLDESKVAQLKEDDVGTKATLALDATEGISKSASEGGI